MSILNQQQIRTVIKLIRVRGYTGRTDGDLHAFVVGIQCLLPCPISAKPYSSRHRRVCWFRLQRIRIAFVIILCVHHRTKADLFEVAQTRSASGVFACSRENGKENGSQNCYDCNDDQKFYKSKCFLSLRKYFFQHFVSIIKSVWQAKGNKRTKSTFNDALVSPAYQPNIIRLKTAGY